MGTYRPPRKYLPIRASGYQNYPDGKWLMGTFWTRLVIADPLARLAWRSNFRMRLRKIWPYANSQTASNRWSGAYAKWWDDV